MFKFKNVLVGVQFDFAEGSSEARLTPDSGEAVSKAVQLAENIGCKLTFVTAFESQLANKADVAAALSDEDTVVPAIHRSFDRVVGELTAKGIEVSWEFLFGVAWKELCNKISTDHHDLLIVGSRNLSGFAKAFLGGTSKRVLHYAPCPVWVARPRDGRDYERILIATDLTEVGNVVLEYGLSLASWNKSEVFVVHAVPNWFEGRWYRAGMARHIVVREHDEERLDARRRLGQQLSPILATMTLATTPQVRVETGTPEHVIWQIAEDERIDLVVMGIIGRSGMQKYLVGDTAAKLLPELPCSLLAVKPEGYEFSIL